jgi:hypothetical protein
MVGQYRQQFQVKVTSKYRPTLDTVLQIQLKISTTTLEENNILITNYNLKEWTNINKIKMIQKILI